MNNYSVDIATCEQRCCWNGAIELLFFIIDDEYERFAFSKVVDFRHPKDLEKLIDLALKDRGATDATLLTFCEQIIQYSVKTGSTLLGRQLSYCSALFFRIHLDA